MRIAFMGSAALSCPSLENLSACAEDKVVGVVTQPDRPKGRSLQTTPCSVRALASGLGIPVLTPQNVNAPETIAAIKALSPDLIVVVAYGQILKSALLQIPARGCINVHASLLPKYRGAAPIQWAIARGEKVTGVSILYMDKKLDSGDIISQREEPIRDDDISAALHDRLAQLGAELLTEVMKAIRQGTAPRKAQTHAEASYAPKLKKSDGRIDWSMTAVELGNRIRGFNPWPCCYFIMPQPKPLRVRVLESRVEPGTQASQPGKILQAGGEGPLIGTGTQALRLLKVQPEGRKPMSGASFLSGHPLRPGEHLE